MVLGLGFTGGGLLGVFGLLHKQMSKIVDYLMLYSLHSGPVAVVHDGGEWGGSSDDQT